jgi:hypothetical protein
MINSLSGPTVLITSVSSWGCVVVKVNDSEHAVRALAEFNLRRPFVGPAGQDCTTDSGIGIIEHDNRIVGQARRHDREEPVPAAKTRFGGAIADNEMKSRHPLNGSRIPHVGAVGLQRSVDEPQVIELMLSGDSGHPLQPLHVTLENPDLASRAPRCGQTHQDRGQSTATFENGPGRDAAHAFECFGQK